jgi:hypothetical protein
MMTRRGRDGEPDHRGYGRRPGFRHRDDLGYGRRSRREGVGAVIRLAPVVFGALVLVLVAMALVDLRRSRRSRSASVPPAVPRKPLLAPRQRHYDYERKTDQLRRRAKNVPGPQEDRAAILAFLESRTGVQAWVEPRTVMHPLSVVLVAGDGEW